jgi:hypothetical protein
MGPEGNVNLPWKQMKQVNGPTVIGITEILNPLEANPFFPFFLQFHFARLPMLNVEKRPDLKFHAHNHTKRYR